MNQEQFNRERLYQVTLAIARTMRRKGLLTDAELVAIDIKMREKYRPILGSIYAEISQK